jgi:hypothetical protein
VNDRKYHPGGVDKKQAEERDGELHGDGIRECFYTSRRSEVWMDAVGNNSNNKDDSRAKRALLPTIVAIPLHNPAEDVSGPEPGQAAHISSQSR